MALSGIEILLDGVSVSFGQTSVLDGLSLAVNRGSCACVTGPSGSGKTTMLRLVNGLLRPDSGTVRVGPYDVTASSTDLAAARRHAGTVLQGSWLFPHKTALQNVAMGQRHILGRTAAEAERTSRALLQRLGLADQTERYPVALSAGQQQRVALARAMAMGPKVLLLDEATASLDAAMSAEIAALLREKVAQGLTVLAASHDERFIELVADETFRLAEGRLSPVGQDAQRQSLREVSW